MASVKIVAVTRDNYHKFKAMVNRRLDSKTDSSQPQAADLEFLGQDNIWVYAAETDSKFVGWVSAVLIPKPDARRGVLYIDELWTEDQYRNHGIGRLLLDEAIGLARELKLWKIRLYVDNDNPAARKLYANAGFREEPQRAALCQRQP